MVLLAPSPDMKHVELTGCEAYCGVFMSNNTEGCRATEMMQRVSDDEVLRK